MNIHWHKRAAAQLHQVEEYVLRDFGFLLPPLKGQRDEASHLSLCLFYVAKRFRGSGILVWMRCLLVDL